MKLPSVAVVGSGPTALMAADVLSDTGAIGVTVFDKRAGLGRKLLIAGSSGLNITNSLPLEEFISHYTGPREFWDRSVRKFTPQAWIHFIENDLGISTFEGTSGRFFVENMKAAELLRAWRKRLTDRKVRFELGQEMVGFSARADGRCELSFAQSAPASFDAVLFALGGGSYETEEKPLRWPEIFQKKNLQFQPFRPSNVGYELAWTPKFLEEAEGKPIKGMSLRTAKGRRQGEIVVTRYGLEGTPVYFVGQTGPAWIDFRPDQSTDSLAARLQEIKENLSPLRRIKKLLHLDEAALALLYHFDSSGRLKAPAPTSHEGWGEIAQLLKNFPIELKDSRPLDESISSSGGLDLSELTEDFMLRKFPGFFAAGEMLDWDVPTGGFLIQGCVAQGAAAGQGILKQLKSVV